MDGTLLTKPKPRTVASWALVGKVKQVTYTFTTSNTFFERLEQMREGKLYLVCYPKEGLLTA